MVRPEGYGVQYPFDVEQPTLRGACIYYLKDNEF